MRSAKSAVAIVVASVLLGSLAYGLGVVETFEGYPYGPTADWFFVSDVTLAANPTWIYATTIADPGDGSKADRFTLTSVHVSPTWANDNGYNQFVWFETGILDPVVPSYFVSDISLSVNPVVAAANPSNPYLVDNIYYYLSANDGTSAYWYEARLDVAANAEYLQTYDLLSLDNVAANTWYRYINGVGDGYVAAGTNLAALISPNLTAVGLAFEIGDFAPAGQTSYMTIWVDNVLVPEPSALILACFGLVGLLARRQRRQAA